MSDTEPSIVNIRRLVDPLSREIERLGGYPHFEGMTLMDVVPKETKVLIGCEHEVWAIRNGEKIERSKWDTTPLYPGDDVIFAHRAQGVLLWVAITLVTTAINIYLARQIKAEPLPSPTYNFGPIETTVRHGQEIPIVYGEHKFGGQWISVYQSINQNGDPVLYGLISLGEGPIQSIAGVTADFDAFREDQLTNSFLLPGGGTTDGTIGVGVEVNDVPAKDIPGIELSGRLGNLNQSVIGGFSDLVTQYNIGIECSQANPVVYRTVGRPNGIEFILNWPEGLFYSGPSGLHAKTVPVYLFFRQLVFTFADIVGYDYINGLPPQYSGYHFKNASVRAKKTSPFTTSIRIDNLPGTLYEFVIFRNWVDDPPDSGHHSKIIVQSVNERLHSQGISYVKRALLAVQAVPSETLGGGLPNVSAIVKGKKVWVWKSGSTSAPWFELEWSENPAWIALDVLTNARYGSGQYLNLNDIDLQSFKDWADYCDESVNPPSTFKKWQVGIVFDSPTSPWEAAQQIAAASRTVLIKTGRKVRAKVDRDASPVQLVTIGNVVKGSFKISYIGKTERANEVEVQFLNKYSGYAQDFVSVQIPAQNEAPKKKSIQLYGITDPARAYRAAKYYLNREQTDRRTVEFKMGIDSIAFEPFDVIALAHDTPSWGLLGGRIYENAASSTTIKLDRDITITGGQTPRITVRTHATGAEVFQTRNISTGAGTYTAGTSLTVSTAWNTSDFPAQGNIYSLVLTTSTASMVGNLYRVTEISRNEDGSATVQAIEHNASVYEDSPGETDHVNQTQQPSESTLPPDVTGLTLQTIYTTNQQGIRQASIAASWIKPQFGAVYSCRVYLRLNLSSDPAFLGAFDFVGETQGESFTIPGDLIQGGNSYTIAVCSVSLGGTQKDPEDSPQATTTISAEITVPPDVEDFDAVQQETSRIRFSWEQSSDPLVTGYEFRRGSSWIDSIVIGQTDGIEFDTFDFHPGQSVTFLMKAFTSAGIYSANAETKTLTTTSSPWTAGSTQTEEPTFSGTKTEFTVVSSKLVQDTTPPTWAGATFAWNSSRALESNWDFNRATYESGTYTLSTNAARYIVADVEFEFNGVSPTWAQAQFSWGSTTGTESVWNPASLAQDGSPFTISLLISRSTDGAAFGAYEPFGNGTWSNCFAFKIKLVAERTSFIYSARISSLQIQTFTL